MSDLHLTRRVQSCGLCELTQQYLCQKFAESDQLVLLSRQEGRFYGIGLPTCLQVSRRIILEVAWSSLQNKDLNPNGSFMGSILSSENLKSVDVRTRVKESIGGVLATVYRDRARKLFRDPISSPTGLRDKAIMAWLKRSAISDGESEFFERLHLDFWRGESGAEFSTNCDHRFNDLFLKKQRRDFEVLEKVWSKLGLSKIVEFGCNSGLLLNYLTAELSGVESATGIDINPTQIESNRVSENLDKRIDFHCTDGGDWLAGGNGSPSTLFVSNGGVLEYFTRDRVAAMFSQIASQLKPAVFFASEPIAGDHDWAMTNDSIPFGEELSFSHNYRYLFESNGFDVVHQRSVHFDQWKMVCTIAIAD